MAANWIHTIAHVAPSPASPSLDFTIACAHIELTRTCATTEPLIRARGASLREEKANTRHLTERARSTGQRGQSSMTHGSSFVVANAASVRGSQVDDTNLTTPWNAVKAILEYRCTLCWSVSCGFVHARRQRTIQNSFICQVRSGVYQQNQCSSHSSMTVSFFMTWYLPLFQTSLHRSSGHFQLKEMHLQCTCIMWLSLSWNQFPLA